VKKSVLVGGLALVVTLTGCGARSVAGQPTGQDGSGSLFGNAQELVRAASTKTGQARSAKFRFTTSMGTHEMTGQGEGLFDGDNSALDYTATTTGTGTAGSMEFRYVDKTVYLKISLPPQSPVQITGGKPWGRVDPSNPMAAALGATADRAQQNDPSQVLQQIQQAGTITRSEQTTLDGQQVDHYWVDIDLAKAASMLGSTSGLSGDELRQLTSQVKTVPVQLWLNHDQLPVQFSEDLTPVMKAAGAPASVQPFTMTMNYSDWGTPVAVQAPPADQVGDIEATQPS
jgi:hypothetical protein